MEKQHSISTANKAHPEISRSSLEETSISSTPVLSAAERREALKERLPEQHQEYADKYFLRSKEILDRDGLNPWVRAQVFIRKGPGEVFGIDEAVAALEKYTSLHEIGGRVFAKRDGEHYESKESLLVLEAPAREIIELETFYLGVISAETTRFNDGVKDVDTELVKKTVASIVEAAEGRPVTYFGARHWDFRSDAAIAHAAFEGGAVAASTDAGAKTFGKEGVGTIPHALENIYAFYKGSENAVAEATLAFDRQMDPSIPRVALIDYRNREIDDSIETAKALQGRLSAVRVDTCGENVAQGAIARADSLEAITLRQEGLPLPDAKDPDAKFWYGTGVTVTGVYALRKALDEAGFQNVKIMLTSGFGSVAKVKAFTRAEKLLGVKLFDALGVGGVYSPCRAATMDIVGVGHTRKSILPLSKSGRSYRPNPELKPVLGSAVQ